MCADAWIALPQAEQAQQQTRRSNEVKRPAPAELSTDQPADHIAKRTANRNRSAKNRHDPAPCFDRKEIREDSRRGGAITALANSNANPSRKENRKCSRQTRAATGQTPQNHSGPDDHPA